jgi:flagellar basal body rod protein FlgC
MARLKGSFSKARPVTDKRQRAWNAMRYMVVFTAADIQATAEIGKDNLKRYIRALAAVGYLRCIQERRSGASMGHAVWSLVRNSGPKHPLALKDGRVYDPNTDTVFERVADDHKTTGIGVARRSAAGL